MPKVAYITANTPFGIGEEFIINEINALKKLNAGLLILPRDRPSQLFHRKAEPLTMNTLTASWFDFGVALRLLKALFLNPFSLIRILSDIFIQTRNPAIALKNLAVLPKAVYLSESVRKASVTHLHAHWGTTTSTMAYIISILTGIPWSLTLHRGDIKENNMLKVKVNAAMFTRCISENGKRMVLNIVGKGYENKIVVIPMGVESDELPNDISTRNVPFVIAVPASLLPVKGHKYMIETCALLKKHGMLDFRCYFFGLGYLRNELMTHIEKAGLIDCILMPGQIPNEELMELYKTRKVDLVVLPSINTEDGDHEGVPVSLMEAMAHGIPVISTNTGGVSELIGDGSGIMIEEKNSEALADAILEVSKDAKLYGELVLRGWQKVRTSYNIDVITGELLRLYSSERIT